LVYFRWLMQKSASKLGKWNALLQSAEKSGDLSMETMRCLLGLERPEDIEALFSAARRVRMRHFGNRVFLYGFLYITTHCRNRCNFCLYSSGNSEAPRYRKTREEIISLSVKMAESGIHLIDLTMGEDPTLYQTNGEGFADLLNTVEGVIDATELPVMVSPGVVPTHVLRQFVKLGADWYACYQETHNRGHFAHLREGQDYDRRMLIKSKAHEQGLLIEEGVLTGTGENHDDLLHSISVMQKMGADQVRAMTFIPQNGTPMASRPWPDPLLELKMIAIMRLCMPDRLIPASLDIDGLAGLERRLDAGANVVTSLVTPGQGLAGVAQRELDIEDGGRTPEGVIKVLKKCRLIPAKLTQYRQWIDQRRTFRAEGHSGIHR